MPLKGFLVFLMESSVIVVSVAQIAHTGEILRYAKSHPCSGYVVSNLDALKRATDEAPTIVTFHHFLADFRGDVTRFSRFLHADHLSIKIANSAGVITSMFWFLHSHTMRSMSLDICLLS